MPTTKRRTRRRICWPNPDTVCLEGGCSYCNENPFRGLAVIRRWIDAQNKPPVKAWRFGLDNDFFNVEVV
jgi:hypothetical protein